MAGVLEKPRWEEAALKRSSARCAEGEDAMRRAIPSGGGTAMLA